MLSKIKSFGLHGIKGYEVSLEIDINNGLPGIEIVGLPDAAIKESKERVRSAIKNSGFLFTPKKITINFAPADTKKEGSIYDLGVAMGILRATEQGHRRLYICRRIVSGRLDKARKGHFAHIDFGKRKRLR